MKHICVQGLGFVGSAMSVAIASSKKSLFVTGLEKNNEKGRKIVSKINNRKIPFITTDKSLIKNFKSCVGRNFNATTDDNILKKVDVVVSNINLDLILKNKKPSVNFENLKNIYKIIGKKVKKNTLIILETTVPPGTSENIILPILENEFNKRGYKKNEINFVYSYERVMPGKDYLNSIKNFWRVYSANSLRAEKMFKKFCSDFINIEKYPMTKLENLRSAETSKILENSYRATNIAFIQEWTEFSKSLNINLFPIIEAIKIRPTHRNIMQPGLGVGGYCLTKDPTFGKISMDFFFKGKITNNFNFSTNAVECNNSMPNFTLKCILEKVKKLNKKKILFFGITYKSDVEDTRYSPSTYLANKLKRLGAKIFYNDDLSKEWNEVKGSKEYNSSNTSKFDIIIFNLKTLRSRKINFLRLKNFNGLIVDVSNSLSDIQKKQIKKNKLRHVFIGNFA